MMVEKIISENIEELNKKRSVHFVREENCLRSFVSSVAIGENQFCRMRISFSEYYPSKMPDIFLIEPQKRYMHMDSKGKLCLFDNSSILINDSLPEQLLLDCFDKAIKIITTDVSSQIYVEEVMREFESYWCTVAKLKMYSAVEVQGSEYFEAEMFVSNGIKVLASSEEEAKFLACNYLNAADNENSFSAKCLVIGLRRNAKLIELKDTYKWRDIRKYVLDNVSGSVKREFKKFLSKRVKNAIRYMVLSFPGKYGNILFGFRLSFTNRNYEKIEKLYGATVECVYINRIDRAYLLQRCGAESSLSRKKVLLLGCGSVGGYLANNLCQLGIESLDLLDADWFAVENVHRHFLGIDAIKNGPRNKAILLKQRLEEMYPYVDIDSLDYKDRSAEFFISKSDRLKHYDLVVSALGEPTVNLKINRILCEQNINVPFVCCFNEPYGIGGHAIATNIEKNSCLRCLYTDVISSELVQFKASYVKAGQNFRKNISGCGSAFVPYSCLDSQQTAIVTARLVADILKNREVSNCMRSWVGTSVNLEEAGFEVSDFYRLHSEEATLIKMEVQAAKYCPICNARRRC